MISLRVHDPSGSAEIKWLHAPRLAALDGHAIAFLSNDMWQAHRTLPLLQELLKGSHPSVSILSHQEFPQGNAQIDSDDTVARVLARGAQAAVIGNAA
ncbi:MAG TPA: hypothetical protein VL359_06405 [bacterium]|nr:hypothetical protein [bacterium]